MTADVATPKVWVPWPFAGVRPHLVMPGGRVVAWITGPPGLLTSIAPGATIDVDVARYLTHTAEAALRERWPDVTRFYYVHDFARATGHDNKARQIFASWAVSRAKQVEQMLVTLPPADPVFRMGMSAATLALRLSGVRLEFASSAAAFLEAHRLAPAT